MKYNPALTGLRGFAVTVVAMGHLAHEGMFFAAFDKSAKVGVWIFFVLSAYLMTKLYLDRSPAQAMGSYVRARIGRVFPLYYLIVALSTAVVGVTAWRYQFGGPADFAMAFGMVSAPWELWAVPVEVQFYVVFAAFWYLWDRGLSRLQIVLLLGVVAIVCVAVTVGKWLAGLDYDGLNLYLYIFAIGVAMAINEERIVAVVDWMRKRVGAWTLALVSLALFVASMPAIRPINIPPRLDPIAIAASAVLVALVLADLAPLRVLRSRPLLFLGEISYGFYLIHYVVLWAAISIWQPSMLLAVPVIVLSLLLATISYRWFERPANAAIKSMGRKPRNRPDEAVATETA